MALPPAQDVSAAARVLPAADYRLEAALPQVADYPAAFALLVARAYRLAQPACSYRAAPERVELEAADSNSAAA